MKAVNESQRDWDERLPLVLAAYRATPHESTGLTPNKLFLGHEVRMPIDLIMGFPPEESYEDMSAHDYLVKLHQDASEAYQLARKHLRASAERRKKVYDVRVKAEQFKVGDWVLKQNIFCTSNITRDVFSRGQLNGRKHILVRTWLSE